MNQLHGVYVVAAADRTAERLVELEAFEILAVVGLVVLDMRLILISHWSYEWCGLPFI